MSLPSQSLLANSSSRISFYFTTTHITSIKTPNFALSIRCNNFLNLPHFRIPRTKSPTCSNFKSSKLHHWHLRLRAFDLDGNVRDADSVDNINLDALLPILEFLCLVSCALISIGLAVNSAASSSHNPIIAWLGNRVFVWQFVLLVGAVAIGALIRRRQWRRTCVNAPKPGGPGVNVIEKIESLEEDIRSLTTTVRNLSRRLEKLGIRFRVTRKGLKEPIAEIAALAQKNSEATRALAVQEDILEKELSEIQKVLLAMQEQQQKQLELILAIAKSGKLWDAKREPSPYPEKNETIKSAKAEKAMATPQAERI